MRDPETYTLVRTIANIRDSDTMAWRTTIGGNTSYPATWRKVFAEHQMLSVYLPDVSANSTEWSITATYDYGNQTAPANDYRDVCTYTYSIATPGKIEYTKEDREYTGSDPLGIVTYTEIEQRAYVSNREDVSLTPGNTVTYPVTPSISRSRIYNSTTQTLDPAILYNPTIGNYAFMNTGTYLIVPSALQSRSSSLAL